MSVSITLPGRKPFAVRVGIGPVEAIAREHLGLRTLATRGSDALDFHEHSVASIREALAAAYEAGRASR